MPDMPRSCAQPMQSVDLSSARRVHIIGAGGAGMNAISSVLASMGHAVTGSDMKQSIGVDRLRSLGADIAIGHDASHLTLGGVRPDYVARSTAVPDHNPEVVAANEAGVPVLHRAEILAAISGQKRTIAVAGTHGKTTTSSMLSLLLVQCGFDPSFIVGGDVNEIGSGAVWNTAGEWFAVEADESDGTFLQLGAEAIVITNIEADHLDYYGDFETLERAFDNFVGDAAGPRIVCVDDDGVRRLIDRTGARATTYGFAADAAYRIVDLQPAGDGVSFAITFDGPDGRSSQPIDLPIPGAHNALNATAAFAMVVELGGEPVAAAEALARFGGVARRFEFRGELDGVTLVDDYAHLPTEVAAAISAGKGGRWDRVVAVFQPHRYSRTAELWETFGSSFADADRLFLTPIYAAGEAPRPGITGELIEQAVRASTPDLDVSFHRERDELRRALLAELRAGDLCLTLGAGDLTSLPDELLALRSADEPPG